MKVTLVGMTELVADSSVSTDIDSTALEEATPYKRHGDWLARESTIDELHEAAGRACYQSWNRPNPATSDNESYLAHINEVKHFSILGHGYVNFYVEGVSRALLLELERHSLHMNLNFSVLSQRYVNHDSSSDIGVVKPPIFDEYLSKILDEHFRVSQERYEHAVEYLVKQGHGRKAARGAARAFLPEGTETRFLVSGTIRAWRDVITKRDDPSADQEIQEFAREVKRILLEVAPNSMIGV